MLGLPGPHTRSSGGCGGSSQPRPGSATSRGALAVPKWAELEEEFPRLCLTGELKGSGSLCTSLKDQGRLASSAWLELRDIGGVYMPPRLANSAWLGVRDIGGVNVPLRAGETEGRTQSCKLSTADLAVASSIAMELPPPAPPRPGRRGRCPAAAATAEAPEGSGGVGGHGHGATTAAPWKADPVPCLGARSSARSRSCRSCLTRAFSSRFSRFSSARAGSSPIRPGPGPTGSSRPPGATRWSPPGVRLQDASGGVGVAEPEPVSLPFGGEVRGAPPGCLLSRACLRKVS